MKKLSCRYYNNRIKTFGNGNFQSHDQEESKLNSTINANSGAHLLTFIYFCNVQTIKIPFDKNNAATIKRKKKNANTDPIISPCRIGTMVSM